MALHDFLLHLHQSQKCEEDEVYDAYLYLKLAG